MVTVHSSSKLNGMLSWSIISDVVSVPQNSCAIKDGFFFDHVVPLLHAYRSRFQRCWVILPTEIPDDELKIIFPNDIYKGKYLSTFTLVGSSKAAANLLSIVETFNRRADIASEGPNLCSLTHPFELAILITELPTLFFKLLWFLSLSSCSPIS